MSSTASEFLPTPSPTPPELQFIYIVHETFVHEESGEEEHCVLAAFTSLSDANTLAKDRAEEIHNLTKTSRHAVPEYYKIEETENVGDGCKKFVVAWRCRNTIMVERMEVRREKVRLGSVRTCSRPDAECDGGEAERMYEGGGEGLES